MVLLVIGGNFSSSRDCHVNQCSSRSNLMDSTHYLDLEVMIHHPSYINILDLICRYYMMSQCS